MAEGPTIGIAGRAVSTSNPDKVLFPGDGVTKADMVDYYRRVADVMLPHMAGRPLTLRRFPDGIGAQGFYQKQASDHFPEWLRRVEVETSEGLQQHVVVDDAAGLVYLADQAVVEFHPWPARAAAMRIPDRMIFDIDPPEEAGLAEIREGVRAVGAVLEEIDVAWFLMTSGSKGFHLVIPLVPEADVDEVRAVARTIAGHAASRSPDLLTTAPRKDSRHGRIFVDYLRNAYGQTSIAPYSLRARPGAPVATPIDREELGTVEPRSYTIANLFRRLGQKEDPWVRIDRQRRPLPGRVG